MVDCRQCGFPLQANKKFCIKCGAKVEIATTKPSVAQQAGVSISCSACNAAVPAGRKFCTQCGYALNLTVQNQATPSASSTSSPNTSSKQGTAANVTCTQCGVTVPATKGFCTSCGNPMKAATVPAETKTAQVKLPNNRTTPARHLLWKVALPIAAIIVIAVGAFFVYTLFIRKPRELNDKQLLETYYGPPPFFTVILAKDESQPSPKSVRREIWVYPEKNASFVFLDSKYQFSSDLQSFRKDAPKTVNKLRIEQITEALTTDEFTKLIGTKPISEIRLPEAELPGAIQYEYGNGVSAVFSQGRLLMARIMPAPENR